MQARSHSGLFSQVPRSPGLEEGHRVQMDMLPGLMDSLFSEGGHGQRRARVALLQGRAQDKGSPWQGGRVIDPKNSDL